MKIQTFVLTFFLIIVVGCSSASPTRLPMEPTQHQSPTIPTATTTRLETSTPTIAIPTNTDIPMRTCENDGFPVESASELNISGEVLLLSTVQTELNALNLETQAVSTVYSGENSEVSVFGSSPDGNWLVYAILPYDPNGDITNEFTLELLSQTGERIHHQMSVSQFEPLFKGDSFVGFGSSTWINNELIYTTLLIQNPSQYGSKTPGSMPMILNPFTGSWEEDLISIQMGSEREIGFSPDLQRVVLQAGSEIRLKDLLTGTSLWNTDEFFLEIPDSKIRWSPNGNMVAVGWRSREPRIFLVSADGSKSERLLPIGTIEGFLDFEWSPNSQFLMLYQESYDDQQGNEPKQFYLYDTLKGQIVLECPVQQPWQILFEWSPDSSQVIYGTDEGTLQLLDIPSGKVTKLNIENVFPFSWTEKSFPH